MRHGNQLGRAPLLLALVLGTACSAEPPTPVCDEGTGPCLCGTETCGAEDRCDALAERCVPALAPKCTAGSAWTPGAYAFRPATEAWNLDTLAAEGVRISVADIDGDGLADLSLRRTGSVPDDFTPGGRRTSWLLRNTGEAFTDVTRTSGLVTPRTGSGADAGRPIEVVVFADVDNDGDLDAYTGMSTPGDVEPVESPEIMLNDGQGRFSLGPEDSELRMVGNRTAVAGAAFTDVNRDGLVDLWIGNGGSAPKQDQLFLSVGGGVFFDMTRAYGLETDLWALDPLNAGLAHSFAWSAAACDLNGDGSPELLAGSYGRAPNHLWEALRDDAGKVSFENRSVASGYAFDARTDWSDNESARCWCKLHPTDPGCEGVPSPAYIACSTDDDAFRWNHATDRELYRLGGNSATTVCADVDNDGDLDLLTTEIRHGDVGTSSDPSELLLNTGATPLSFERPGNEATGLTRDLDGVLWDAGDMTAAVFDFDNDGRPDVYLGSSDYSGTRGWLYHQEADGRFAAVPVNLGIDHTSSHGIAVADFDRDGDLDVVAGHSRSRCSTGDHCYDAAHARFYRNVLGHTGNWVQLRLEGGPRTNRAAIGAQVTVTAGGLTQTQEVGGGHGHFGIQHDLVLHFGLGTACDAEVSVRWPDASLTTERFTVQSGYRYHVLQGELPVAEE